ncbi:peroxiredoxin-like family protein [Chryseobacterium ginsengisoli]|uniref:thioredoxin-dependent peroxiredoxin n=1 Tax=Chryseobacterium ginsengisoli TaxID=363853 RepID=A0ABP9MAE1_9FLAO
MQNQTDLDFQLEPRLQKIREWVATNITPEENEIMENHIKFLQDSGATEKILKEGDIAPEFNLKNQNGEIISSTELLKTGPLVVSFYRGAWCPYCVEEVKVLNSVYSKIKNAGADLVVISPQSFSRTEKQAKQIHLQYNMLVDQDNAAGKAFGLVYEMPQDLKDLYWNKFQNNIQEVNESNAWELPIPARFIIGQDGKILSVQADPDYRYRPEPLETVSFIKKLN